MLLEMWAYALDILGFYDERIANEAYLRTALLRPSLRKLVGLIGYQARPALAASVVLAAIADGVKAVKLPLRTGFRSDAFDGEPPQVFETEVEHTIHPLKNEWTLGPVRDRFPASTGEILLEPATARLNRDQLVLFRWKRRLPVFNGVLELSAGTLGPFSDSSDGLPFIVPIVKDPQSSVQSRILEGLAKLTFPPQPVVIIPLDPLVPIPFPPEVEKLIPGQVITTEHIDARDGGSYLKVDIKPVPRFDADIALNDIEVLSPSLTATPNPFVSSPAVNITHTNLTSILLDGVYPQIRVDDLVIVQHGTDLRAARVRSAVVDIQAVIVSNRTDPPATIPATVIQIEPQLPAIGAAVRGIVIHFNMVDGGKVTRVAKTHLNAADFTPPGIPTEGLIEPIPESVARPSELLLLDAQDNGARANGSVDINPEGEGKVQLAPNTPPFQSALRTPVTVFGNLVRATRGESVFNEVLGSGNASQSFQVFTLGNKPLTYLNDPSAPNGRRSTLEVRVNGIKWKEVPSFFGTGRLGEVYIVRQNDEQETIITFGDGETGARLATGVDNITAIYRFGAGAAKPPAGAIGQLASPVEGLRRVVNPVAAGGGADADQPKDIRRNAPNSALLLGRAVSVPDFEALAREFGGVINAHVE